MVNKSTFPFAEGKTPYEEKLNSLVLELDKKVSKKKILLHSCCGPCSTTCIERLASDYDVTIFFYNPNITDKDEYLRRKETQMQFIHIFNQEREDEDKIKFMEGEYIVEDFFSAVKGLETEAEGGTRCIECFKLRLDRTADVAKKGGYHLFGTTLTVSPHKNYLIISAIGAELSEKYGVEFLDKDFKKQAGYQRSIEISKECNLYRQNYCGCVFSKR